MNEWTSTPQFEESIIQSFGVPEIRTEFVDQVYGYLMKRAIMKSRKSRTIFQLRPAWLAILVFVILLTACTLIIGPEKVYNAVRQLFGYIPGVGIVDQSSPIRVLAEPVTVTREGISITVTSATLTNDRTHIDYRIFGVPGSAYPDREDVMGCTQQPYLRLPDGTRLTPQKDFPPVPANVNEAVFVLPCISNTLPGKVPENWELPLHFMPAPPDLTVVPVIETLPSQTPSVMANTPSSEINPLTITKVLDIGDEFVLMGEFSYSATQDASLPAGSWWAIQSVSIIGADGREVPQTYSNDFTSPPPTRADSETWLYQLKKNFVPPVTITYTGEIISPVGPKEQAEFEFDAGINPQDGSKWTVNKNFRLGGYNILLVSIESSQRGYSFHFKADPGASANAINVNIVGYSPNCGGGGGGDQFSIEFDREVCYTSFSGSPEFPHGKLKVVVNFQSLTRQNKSFQIRWNPDMVQTGLFSKPTPQPRVCLAVDSLTQIQPAPAKFSNGKALIYEKLDTSTWGLVLYYLDGNQKHVVVPKGNWGALSPDGSLVAYSASDNGIHIIDLESQTEKVLPNSNGFNFHWSPDGKKIAYIGMGDSTINSVFVVNADGTQVHQISKWSYEAVIGWSSDSSQLFFVTPYTGGAAWKVYSYNLANNETRERFTIENGTPKFLNAKLSPDGNWIAYRGRDNSSLYLVHPDGSDMHLVLDGIGAVGVEWSRSGWLGVSVQVPNSTASRIVIVKPERCEAYLLSANLKGELEGLFIP